VWSVVPDLATIRKLTKRFKLPRSSRVCWVDARGRPIAGETSQGTFLPPSRNRALIAEAMRWGEPAFCMEASGSLLAAVPLCLNQQPAGGVLLEIRGPDPDPLTARSTAEHIRVVLEKANWINAALLRERSRETCGERLRAEAIHAAKGRPLGVVRSLYWKLEPELFLAMRRGDRPEARRLLNEILVGIYSFGDTNMETIKGLLLDLVNTMTRTMIECGADPASSMGENFAELEGLLAAQSEEALSRWVSTTLERIIGLALEAPTDDRSLRLQLAINAIQSQCDQPLTRDNIARQIGMSPTHFSRCLKAATGDGFSAHLRRARLEHAAKALRQSDETILSVALDAGFQDAANFSRVFRQSFGCSPSAYRKKSTK
jgi:AraC-like DNA-binding protein